MQNTGTIPKLVDIGAFIISLVYLEIKMRSEVVLYENHSQSGQ